MTHKQRLLIAAKWILVGLAFQALGMRLAEALLYSAWW